MGARSNRTWVGARLVVVGDVLLAVQGCGSEETGGRLAGSGGSAGSAGAGNTGASRGSEAAAGNETGADTGGATSTGGEGGGGPLCPHDGSMPDVVRILVSKKYPANLQGSS